METQSLIRRLLDTPAIAEVVPRLEPEILHRVIERCGLEACAEIVALATPRQLERLLDIDLWRAPSAGADERLDADRFGVWVEVLAGLDADVAADRLAAMDLDLVVGGLTGHVGVFDGAAVAPYTMLDGTEVPGRTSGRGPTCEIGGFVLEGRGSTAWQAIVDLLAQVYEMRPAFFYRIMRGCVRLSDGPLEEDAFHDLLDRHDQHRADLAAEREARRDRQGYVAPAPARAFLHASRHLDLAGLQPAMDAIARAALRDMAPAEAPEEDPAAAEGVPSSSDRRDSDARAVTTVMEILTDAGVVTRPRALLTAGDAGADDDPRLALVRELVLTCPSAMEELAFLANALLGGCAIQDRPFTPQEASDAVLATCNLGLENWPAGWPDRNLVTAFQIGWAVLHRDLCRRGAMALAGTLAGIDCSDRDVQWSLQTLRREVIRHLDANEPWRARPALDAILMLDAAAWAVLRALIDECPTLHATLASSGRALRVDPDAFTFAARNAEIGRALEYLAELPAALTG